MLRLAAFALVLAAGSAGADKTFVVNSLADVPAGANPYDGVCETATGNGVCTLRAAVMEANYVSAGITTIRVPAGTYHLTIPEPEDDRSPANGDLDILKPTTLIGDGPSATILDGGGITRLIFAGAEDVTIRDLTVANGDHPHTGIATGISNWNELLLENVRVTGSKTNGGIYNQGTLVMRNCRVDGNESINGGGGINNREFMLIQDSLIDSNTSRGRGGGIDSDGDLTVERTSFVGNYTTGQFADGGAIYVQDSGLGEPSLKVINSEFFANSTTGSGGAVYVYSGPATLINVTITSNIANSDNEGEGVPPVSQGGLFGGGIGRDRPEASILLKNSIVADNHSKWGTYTLDDDCGPLAILSGDYNIGKDFDCFLTGQEDHVVQANPELDTIDMNAGFGLNSATTSGPGYGMVPPGNCTDLLGAPLTTDFRGHRRGPGNCDVGAHEAFAYYAPPSPYGVELMRNGGAAGSEIGDALSDANPGFTRSAPYWWRSTGTLLQVLYGTAGGYPTTADAPPRSGQIFFSGGTNPVSFAKQEFDISALATQIDAGTLRYRASGAFGGYATDGDNALMTVAFRDASDAILDSVDLGGFTAADRGNATKLMRDADSGFVPVGTRSAQVSLTMTRTNGASNDGYSDDISLVLPEPGAVASAAVALAALAWRARRRRSCRLDLGCVRLPSSSR